MSAAAKCDGCGKFATVDASYLHGYARVPLPDDWFRVAMMRADGSNQQLHEWHVCSLACAVPVAARVAEKGELP